MSHSRCLYCMAELSGQTCPTCGAAVGALIDNPFYLPTGITLNNRYLIGKVIGFGGFGVVYIAFDTNLDVRVAVKEFLPKDLAGRSGDHLSLIPYAGGGGDELAYGIQKFLEEAKALAKFQDHPGIVTVYESFRANNTAYMVMQYLDGMTMKEYLKRQPEEKLPFETAIKAMLPIMDALREVHKAGFVHRDISPDNIFITRQNQVKLLDFGAARYALGEHSKSLTSILKHGYAPVEQYSSKGNQGPWTDVYAVSATIYRCITGETPPDAMERIQEESLKPPRQLGVAIPAYGELALLKGLALRAVERFESIEQLQQALAGIAKPLGSPFASTRVHVAGPKVSPSQKQTAVEPTRVVKPLPTPSLIVESEREGFRFYKDVVIDTRTGLMWARNGNIAGKTMTWKEANEWVIMLNLDGYGNWHLPTKEEFLSLIMRGDKMTDSIGRQTRYYPYKWLANCGFNNVPDSNDTWYWSSFSNAVNCSYAWLVDLGGGGVRSDVESSSRYSVWPVRTEQ